VHCGLCRPFELRGGVSFLAGFLDRLLKLDPGELRFPVKIRTLSLDNLTLEAPPLIRYIFDTET